MGVPVRIVLHLLTYFTVVFRIIECIGGPTQIKNNVIKIRKNLCAIFCAKEPADHFTLFAVFYRK